MKNLFNYLSKLVHRTGTVKEKQLEVMMPDKKQPERYPFTEWYTYGMHLYKDKDEDPTVEFVEKNTGKRRTLVDENGRIIDFPGIEMGGWVEDLDDPTCLEPVVRFRSDFAEVENGTWKRSYMMIWQIQPDGRYWEDEEGFGGTSDPEICLYAFINGNGNFSEKFRLYKYGTKMVYEEQRRLEKEEQKRKEEESKRKLEEATKEGMKQLYKLIDPMPEMGKYEQKEVSYCIPNQRYEVTLSVRHNARNSDFWELYLGVCSIYSDCMHSYCEFKGTYEALKANLKNEEKVEEFVEDSIRLTYSIDD